MLLVNAGKRQKKNASICVDTVSAFQSLVISEAQNRFWSCNRHQ